VFVFARARFSTSAMKKLAKVGPNGEPIDIPSHCLYIVPSISRNGTSVVHIRSNFSNMCFGITGAGIVGWLYTLSRMMLIVRFTGTFVNSDSTSRENKFPTYSLLFRRSTNSVEDFNILP
jgi:hypothetical protein